MARDLLFEIGVEEVPASYVLPALSQLACSLERELTSARLSFESTRTFATPRRMTVIVKGVADAQTSETKTITGPPARIAFGDDGAPTKAATGFARSQGVDVDSILSQNDYLVFHIIIELFSFMIGLFLVLFLSLSIKTFSKQFVRFITF